MRLKSFIDSDIEDFRKLNVGIVKESKDELVRKIEEKFGIKNNIVSLLDDINILLGKDKRVGFTFEEEEIKINKLNKSKLERVKLKIFESNSFLSEMKRQLERKLTEEE